MKEYITLEELSEGFAFCKSSSSALLVLLFLKSLFTAIKRVQFLECTFNNSVHKKFVWEV